MITPLDKRPRSGPYSGLNARSAKRFLTQTFQEAGLRFAENDAEEILLLATGLDKAGLMLRGHDALTPEASELVRNYMMRRIAGEPIDHILGWREFYGRRFTISRDVLSPRADTENIIRSALRRLENERSPNVLDLGTGSGAIGLTILAERADAQLMATDISEAALAIASQNARALGLEDRADFRQGAWWQAIPSGSQFDMILSNPPYISDAAMENLEGEVKNFDPDLALRGGLDGLEAYRGILSKAKAFLKPSGYIGFEIGFDQADAVTELLCDGVWTDIICKQDLGGLDRIIWARNSG